MNDAHVLPLVVNAWGSSLKSIITKQNVTTGDAEVVCLDVDSFPSSITAEINLLGQACSNTISFVVDSSGHMVPVVHSVTTPNIGIVSFVCSPKIAILSGTTYTLPLSNIHSGATADGYTIAGRSYESTEPNWGSKPSNYYVASAQSALNLSTGYSFTGSLYIPTIGTWVANCTNSKIEATFGIMDTDANRGMFLSLRRNSDLTSIARVWQSIFQITTTWSGDVQLLLNGVVQSTSTYTRSYQSIAAFTRTISGSDVENMSPIGGFAFESGTHASDYFFDLDRSDIFSVTAKS